MKIVFSSIFYAVQRVSWLPVVSFVESIRIIVVNKIL